MISKRMFLGLFASAPALAIPAPPAASAEPEPNLRAQYFIACIQQGLMTPAEARKQIRRPGGPDWPSLPATVKI